MVPHWEDVLDARLLARNQILPSVTTPLGVRYALSRIAVTLDMAKRMSLDFEILYFGRDL